MKCPFCGATDGIEMICGDPNVEFRDGSYVCYKEIDCRDCPQCYCNCENCGNIDFVVRFEDLPQIRM